MKRFNPAWPRVGSLTCWFPILPLLSTFHISCACPENSNPSKTSGHRTQFRGHTWEGKKKERREKEALAGGQDGLSSSQRFSTHRRKMSAVALAGRSKGRRPAVHPSPWGLATSVLQAVPALAPFLILPFSIVTSFPFQNKNRSNEELGKSSGSQAVFP